MCLVARAKTEKERSNQKLRHHLRRLPRPCRRKAITALADELRIHQSFSCEASNGFQESPFVVVFAFVKSKGLLIQVSEKMKRFDRNIRAFDSALEQRPKVLQSVRVDMPFHIAFCVVNHLMHVFIGQFFVRTKFVGVNLRAFLDVFANFGIKIMSANAVHYLQAHARRFFGRVALKQSHDCGFANRAASSLTVANGFGSPIFAHISSLAADERFVGFNAPFHFLNLAVLHRQADSVKHEPSSLLSDPQSAGKLTGTNAVLSIYDQPGCGQPFVESKRTIFKDRADFDGELLPAVFAIPNPPRQNKFANVFRATMRTADSARPTHRGHELMTLVRVSKIANSARQSFGNVIEILRFHVTNLHPVNNASSI
jgi:hypothetical protein